jgi:uncharacterized membrane protein YdbT with pleckstrin-like domain
MAQQVAQQPTYGIPSSPPSVAAEETLWHGTPSWALLFGKFFRLIASAIILPVVLYLGASYVPDYRRHEVWRIGGLAIIAIILLHCIAVAIAYARVKATIYTVTNQRVIIESGLLSKSVEDVDLRTIDDTTFYQSFLDRMLKIGSVAIVSTDKVVPNYVLRGIDDPRALRELIRAQAYQATQRQLFTRAT